MMGDWNLGPGTQSKDAGRHIVRILCTLVAMLLLTSCAGTLSVGLEQTPTPDPAPQATLQALLEENQRLTAALATAAAPPPTVPNALGRVAYIRGGDLWVTLLPEGPHQRLTIDGHNREPLWSTFGEWIAYRKDRTVLVERERPCEEPLREGQPPCRETVSTQQEQVWLARRNGGEHHVINRGFTVERFAWSPAVDILAFVTEAGHLQTIDPATDIGMRLVAARAGGRVNAIAWSPDGLRLAYEWFSDERAGSALGREDGIWVIARTGGQPLWVTRAADSPVSLAGWQDPEHLLIWQHPDSPQQPSDSVWLYSAALPQSGEDSDDPQVVRDEPMLQRPDFIAVSPVAEHIVAATLGAGLPTWTGKQVVAGDLASPAALAAISPAWSPDGGWLAFVGMPDAPDVTLGEDALAAMMERRIWVAPRAPGEPRILVEDDRYRDERPLWSRQGTHILFARMTREGQASLWLAPAGGGPAAQVVDELTPAPDPIGNFGYIDWSQHYDWWRG